MRQVSRFFVAAVLVTAAVPVRAEEPVTTLWDRATLLDGVASPKEALRSRGIATDIWVTQFYQGLVSGTGSRHGEYGTKADAFVTLDGAKLGLWQGLFVNIHQEWLSGEDANNRGGTLLPVNTALALPRFGGYERDTSIIITQVVNTDVSLSAGKFNMQDVLSKTPIIGGGGIDSFMNIGLALPPTGITPPYVLGASLTVKTEPAIFNLFVHDPRNAQAWKVIDSPFEKGTVVLGSVTVPVKPFGLAGNQVFKAAWSTQDGLDLSDVPELLLPPQAGVTPGRRNGRWFLSYGFQQYLYQDPSDARHSWGIFSQIIASDGNPNPIEFSGIVGIAGSGPFPGRSLDRWGVGYFRYNVSDDLISSLQPLNINLRDERGIEAYYNLAVTPWFRLTANVQRIRPVRADRDEATFLGLRSQVKF